MTKEKLAYETHLRGFDLKMWYLEKPNNGDALIEIFKSGKPHREFLFPAYKIWNIAAHFEDIVIGELENNTTGYEMAAWDGISGATIISPTEDK
jgi:hypothetical protein